MDNAAASGRFFMRRVNFPKVLSAIVFGYVLVCSIYPIKDAVTYIGFLLSIVAIWVNPPGSPPHSSSKPNPESEW
jgi:hypothetical protein